MRYWLFLIFLIALISSCKEETDSLVISPPNFSIVSGVYDTSQWVSISTSTADTDIYYTLDGTDPGFYPEYTDSLFFEKNGSYIIKAIARQKDRKPSEIAILEFDIDLAHLKCKPRRFTRGPIGIVTEYTYDNRYRPLVESTRLGSYRYRFEYVYESEQTLIYGALSDSLGVLPPLEQVGSIKYVNGELSELMLSVNDNVHTYKFFYNDSELVQAIINGDTMSITWEGENISHTTFEYYGACYNGDFYEYEEGWNPFYKGVYLIWLYGIALEDDRLFLPKYFSKNNIHRGCSIFHYFVYEYGQGVFPTKITAVDYLSTFGDWGYTYDLEYICP